MRGLLGAAAARSNLRSEGSGSFVLRAGVRVWSDADVAETGRYTLTWASEGAWREEIVLPAFREERGVGAGRSWWKRSSDHPPLRVMQLQQLLDYPERLAFDDKARFKTLGKGRTIASSIGDCVKVKSSPWTSSETLCFDRDRGVLLLEDYPRGGPARLFRTRYEYTDHRPWKGLLVPHRIRFLEKGRPALEFAVDELSSLDAPDAAVIDPPQGARSTPWCANRTDPEIVDKVEPRFPRSAIGSIISATVTLHAVMAADGSLRDVAVIRSARPDFDGAALDAVRRWRYRPAMCGDTPVETEFSIEISFSFE